MSDPWQRPPDAGGPRRPGGIPRWLIIVALIAAAVLGLSVLFPDALSGEDRWLRLLYLIGLGALVGSSFSLRALTRSRQGWLQLARNVGIWIAIVLALMIAYSFRHEANSVWRRVASELLPGYGQSDGTGEIRFAAGRDGHFLIRADVDGGVVEFLVDTGASEIILSGRDAERLGYDLSRLAFTVPFATANGTVRGARIRLKRLTVGPIELRDVRAFVNGGELATSLLGMSFLERLSSYEVRGGSLILRR